MAISLGHPNHRHQPGKRRTAVRVWNIPWTKPEKRLGTMNLEFMSGLGVNDRRKPVGNFKGRTIPLKPFHGKDIYPFELVNL